MLKTQKSKPENTTSELTEEPEVESYPTYTIDSGGGPVTINITISGNENTVAVMAGQPSPPPKPPGGNG